MKTIEQLEAELGLMRRDTAEYAQDRDHDATELLRLRTECWTLSGTIECLRKGDVPVYPSQLKYLE